MPVTFSTTEYEFSYGRKPRGRGCWAFYFGSPKTEPWWAASPEGVSSMTYGEAKKLARAEAARRGVDAVFVGT